MTPIEITSILITPLAGLAIAGVLYYIVRNSA